MALQLSSMVPMLKRMLDSDWQFWLEATTRVPLRAPSMPWRCVLTSLRGMARWASRWPTPDARKRGLRVWFILPVARGRLGHAGSYRASPSGASNCGANLTGRNRFSGTQSTCMVSPTGARAHDRWPDKGRLDGLIGSERSSPDKAYRRAMAVMIRIAALVANWGGESARV